MGGRLESEVKTQLVADVLLFAPPVGIDHRSIGPINAIADAVPPEKVVICPEAELWQDFDFQIRVEVHKIGRADQRCQPKICPSWEKGVELGLLGRITPMEKWNADKHLIKYRKLTA